MRDPNRINRIIEKLRTTWIHSPDQRLGQLVMNAIALAKDKSVNDIFYIEDEDTERGLDLMRTEQIKEGRW